MHRRAPSRLSVARATHTRRKAGSRLGLARSDETSDRRGASMSRRHALSSEETVKSMVILRSLPFATLSIAVYASACAQTAGPVVFEEDSGATSATADGGGGASSGGASSSGSGGSSGIASSSGGGSSSSSGSSSGSPIDSGGGVCSSCSVDQDCQRGCPAGPGGTVWCCTSAICYQAMTACPLPSDGGSDGGGSNSGSDGGRDAAVSVDAGPNDALCQTMATTAACQTCCANNHVAGDQTFTTALQGCACAAGGACRLPCATEYCANLAPTVGDACDTCLNGSLSPDAGGTCINPVTAACLADRDCVALLGNTGCLSGCP
jgi:hypothetical protein